MFKEFKSQDKSFKDEILLIWLIGMLSTGWFETTRGRFEEWVRIINDLPDSVWYLVIIVFTATFSTKMTDKVLNRNKKKMILGLNEFFKKKEKERKGYGSYH